MTRQVSRLEDLGFRTSPQDRSTSMSEKPISPLRQRMIEDMTVRNFVEKTRNDYIRQVKTFTSFLGRSPDTGDSGGSSPLPAASDPDRHPSAEHQRLGCGAALLFYRDARPPRDGPAPHLRAGAAQAAGRAEPRGGGAVAGGRARTEVQGGTECRLRCGSAGLRGGGAEGVGH